ncbi:MAG TPA: right-handed parallel beta-helix repeat-containing protein, partial [Candidatus Dojkabacteria bacterium]|nr:right-handed parallel beta-helix repeat-containing protein [Candidatus Dojkabacteria bacterium]
MIFTLVLARYLSERTEQEDSEAATTPVNLITVCATGTAGQNGCQYVGGDNIQRAVDAAKSGDTILLKAGTYKRTGYTPYNYTPYGESIEKKFKAFIFIPETSIRTLTLKGEGSVVLDGTNSTHTLSGIVVHGGVINIEGLKIIGMKTDEDSCFESNTNTCGLGYGISISMNAKATIRNNSFSNNIGAAIRTYQNSKTTIFNNIITSNPNDGIYLSENSNALITNNIISSNVVSGITIYQGAVHNPSVTVLNNILTNNKKNTDNSFGFGIGGYNLLTPGFKENDKFAYNLTFGNAGEGTSCGVNEFCDSLHADPKFVSATNFALQAGSPAIDAGDPNIKDLNGSRSDLGVYGGPNSCPGGDCSPELKPIILNSSFEWGDYKSWSYGAGVDTSFTQVHDCDQWGPCSDGKKYITLGRKLDGDKTKTDFSTHWIETGQNLSGRTIRVKFNAKAHSTSSDHQPPPALEGLYIQREHPVGSGWLQQIPIPKTALTASWKTYTFDLKIPASTDINTTSFRIVLKPEMNYTYNLGYYYDNIQAEVLAQAVTTTVAPPATTIPPTTTVPPTVVVTPPVTPVAQADNFSQVVLDSAGENFYYRSCNMDKSKADGVDFTKCNNFTYQDEVWTKHSVKSLKIQTGDLVISKLRSLDIDHRIGKYENYDLTRNILYYTALSQDGKTVYTRSCDILDNQDVASCTDWTFTEASKVGAPNVSTIQSIETTTYYREGAYRTLTNVLDAKTPPYIFWSIECVTYPTEPGVSTCSPWKSDDRNVSKDNYFSSNSYVFDSGTQKKMSQSYLTQFLGVIENYICNFNPNSTTPFERCERDTTTTKASTDIESLQIPVSYGSEASLEEAASTSTSVSDLDRLDLPAECRNITLNTNYDDPYPGNRIGVQTYLNTKVPFNEGVSHTLHFFIPTQLEVPTDMGSNPNPACTFAKTEAGDKYTCNLTGGALTINLKVKDNVTPGTPILVNSRVVSSGMTTDCPTYTFNVIQKPTTTPSPSITPTPATITALTCRKVQELPSKLWTGEQVKYKVVLNDLAPGPDGTVLV